MSAEILRKAAALMRERAEAATPGPWQALADGYGDTSRGRAAEARRDLFWVRAGATNAGDLVTTYGCWDSRSAHDVEHIASWHPAVALAVADWLDAAARRMPDDCDCPECLDYEPDALAVARAYLGSES